MSPLTALSFSHSASKEDKNDVKRRIRVAFNWCADTFVLRLVRGKRQSGGLNTHTLATPLLYCNKIFKSKSLVHVTLSSEDMYQKSIVWVLVTCYSVTYLRVHLHRVEAMHSGGLDGTHWQTEVAILARGGLG